MAARSTRAQMPSNNNSAGMHQMPQNQMYMGAVNPAPYSLGSMLTMLTNNAGLVFIALALVVAGFLGGSVYRENAMLKAGYAKGGTLAAAPTDPNAAAPAPAAPLTDDDWKTLINGGVASIGDKNAKVVMVEFTDFQCPFCGQFFTQTYGALKTKYIDTGKLRVVVHDQPLPFHANAKISALAGRCAAEQGKFEAMHDKLFAAQTEWSNLANDAAITKFGEYATGAGMNCSKLVDCVKTAKYDKQVTDDMALGTKLGASGTPTFFINKEILVGAQPTTAFEALIDKNL